MGHRNGIIRIDLILMLLALSMLSSMNAFGYAFQRTNDTADTANMLADDLNPQSPASYLLAAEMELSQQLPSSDFVEELFIRAIYWGNEYGQDRVASAACIGLAAQVDAVPMQDWLWDLAFLLDPSREIEWFKQRIDKEHLQDSTGIDAASCLHAIRYHVHPLAQDLWDSSGIRKRILSIAEQINIDQDGFKQLIEQELRSGAEDSCRGRLFIGDRSNPGSRIACPDHLRGLGFLSNDENLAQFLKVETVLRDLYIESWTAAASLSLDEPIILPSLDQLLERFADDPSLGFYRDGVWVAAPQSEAGND